MAKSNNNSDEDGTTLENGHINRSAPPYTHNTKRKRFKKPRSDVTVNTVEEILKSADDQCQTKPCRRSERRIIPNSLWDNAVINPFYERKRRRIDYVGTVKERKENGKVSDNENKKTHIVDNENIKSQKCENENGTYDKSNGDAILNGDDTNGILDDNFEIGHVRLRRSSRKLSSSVSSLSDTKNPLKQERLKKRHYSSETGEPPKTNTDETDPAPEITNGIKSEGTAPKLEVSASKALPVTDNKSNFSETTEQQPNGITPHTVPPKEEEKHVVPRRRKRYGKIPNHLKEFYQIPVKKERNGSEKNNRASPNPSNESDDIVINSKEALSLIDGTNFHRFYQMRTRRQNSSTEENNCKKQESGRTSRSNSNKADEGAATEASSKTPEIKKRVRRAKPDILCSFCLLTVEERHEELISCFLCGASGHPSCLQFNAALTQRVKLYQWECIECKKCELCRKSGDDATLLFCDDCDKGFHMGCLKPALNGQPEGHWACMYCAEGSSYWKDKIRETVNKNNKVRKRRSDKLSKRKQLLDDLAMFHEAQNRAKLAMDEEARKAPKIKTPKRKLDGKVPPSIKSIEFGSFEINTWYNSPYPAEYVLQLKLYICEFCLKYMKSGVIASRHSAKCPARCPPGDEIYRKDSISVFEVDGRKNKTYCQNLCLLAKLFLDHKTLYYDVEPFLFYILTEYDRKGCHIVGYFSKEKNSFLSYNVSCILVLPPYMKKGYGKMLIDFSYVLSRKEGKLGSPEKPLSDLGLICYRNYWKEKLLEYFSAYSQTQISIRDISQTLGFNPYDIVSTLQAYGMIKYYKANHYILKRPEMIAAYKRKQNVIADLPDRGIDMKYLKWTPPCQRTE